MQFEELGALAGLGGLLRGRELALGQRDASLLRDGADGLGEGEAVHLHDEGEDVALLVAAEAVVVAVGGVDGEGAGPLLVEGAEAGVVLGAGLAQLEVVADDADGFREGDVFNFADEAEHVSRGLASEAVVELADGVDGEGGGLFLVERAEA